jgi:hypothetical protein
MDWKRRTVPAMRTYHVENSTQGPALAAAVRLHDFIRSNAGETADWPMQITSSDPSVIARLDELLREFRSAMETP